SRWGDRAWIEQDHVTDGRPPSATAEAAAEFLPVHSGVFAAQPTHYLPPREHAQVAEGPTGHSRPEVGGPAPQQRVQLMQQDFDRKVDVLTAQRLDLRRRGLPRIPCWVGVNVVLARPPLPAALDVPAEKIEALVDMGDRRLLRRQA